MSILLITVPGKPVPQGSVRPMVNKATGKAYPMHTNLATLRPWRNQVTDLARQELGENYPPELGAVFVVARFYFTRPISHYRTGGNAHLLRETAAEYPVNAADTDKLQRAVGDALEAAGVVKDDKQIVGWDSRKEWADVAHTLVDVRHMSEVA